MAVVWVSWTGNDHGKITNLTQIAVTSKTAEPTLTHGSLLTSEMRDHKDFLMTGADMKTEVDSVMNLKGHGLIIIETVSVIEWTGHRTQIDLTQERRGVAWTPSGTEGVLTEMLDLPEMTDIPETIASTGMRALGDLTEAPIV